MKARFSILENYFVPFQKPVLCYTYNYMRIIVLSFAVILSLFTGCKSVPEPVLPEAEIEEEAPPEILVLSEDEIAIINEVIDHVLTLITRELKNSRSDMQVCIDNEFYLYRVKPAAS